MTDTPHDWHPLSNILQELTSFDHQFRRAFNLSFEIESAIANAIRSGEVAVRGRRNNGFSSLNSAFERIDKYLGPKSYIDISLNRITIPDDGAVLRLRPRTNLLRPQMNPGIFPDSITIPDSGAAGHFADAQADLGGVETWIFKNALPPWRQEASNEEGTPSRRGAPPKYAWNAIREEAFRLMNLNGDFSDDNLKWNAQARLEKKLQEFCSGKKRDDEPAPSTLRDKIPRWLAEWRKQKGTAGN